MRLPVSIDHLKKMITHSARTDRLEQLAAEARVFALVQLPKGISVLSGTVIHSAGGWDLRIYNRPNNQAEVLVLPRGRSGEEALIWRTGMKERLLRELGTASELIDQRWLSELFDSTTIGGWRFRADVILAGLWLADHPEEFYLIRNDPSKQRWEAFQTGIAISSLKLRTSIQLVERIYGW